METKFQFVLSGINIGPNLGDDITYSGTVAAARQGVLMGTPSMAISLYITALNEVMHLDNAARIIVDRFEKLRIMMPDKHFININIPNRNQNMQFDFGSVSTRMYDDFITHYNPPYEKHTYYFMHSEPKKIEPKVGSDWHIVNNNKIAVSYVSAHPAFSSTAAQRDNIRAL